MRTINKLLLPLLILVVMACNKQIDDIKPLTKVTLTGELSTVGGMEATTIGTYSLMGLNFEPLAQDMGEDRGNNVTLQTWAPPSQLTDAFFFQNSTAPTQGSSYNFYQSCYVAILGANTVLDNMAGFDTLAVTADERSRFLYVKGENLFIRALCYFNLVRVYGKPYYQGAGAGLAVPLKKTSDLKETTSTATVKEVYAFIIADLQQAAQLMKAPVTKTNVFASTGAAWALLSRVYLYMGGSIASPDAATNQLAITYADSVIDQSGGKYTLLQGSDYQDMFGDDTDGSLGRSDPSSNKEIIFAFDNAGNNQLLYGCSIGLFYHYDPTYGVGAVFIPSSDLKSKYTAGDMRSNFFEVNSGSGFVETTKWLCLNFYDGTRAPGILFRLGELYLNRAEASAKLGDFAAARTDLKAIHTRAGLPASDIDNLADGAVLAAILLERRLELAFEGHNSFDYFRNGLPLVRTAADNNGTAQTIQPDDPKVIFTIPNN
jgi:hypothetical protein